MTDEPRKRIDLNIDGSVVKLDIGLNEAKALFVVLQDWVADVESKNEKPVVDPVLEAEILT